MCQWRLVTWGAQRGCGRAMLGCWLLTCVEECWALQSMQAPWQGFLLMCLSELCALQTGRHTGSGTLTVASRHMTEVIMTVCGCGCVVCPCALCNVGICALLGCTAAALQVAASIQHSKRTPLPLVLPITASQQPAVRLSPKPNQRCQRLLQSGLTNSLATHKPLR
jgi:hypothetical protein